MKNVATWVTTLVGCAMSIQAHDLWIEKTADGFLMCSGHMGKAHGQEGGMRESLDPSIVRYVRCVGKDGTKKDVRPEAVAGGKGLKIAERCEGLSAFCYRGFFSVTPDGEVNLPKNKAKDAVKSWESKEFVKFVEASSEIAQRRFADEFEVVPVTDLRKAKAGEKVTVRVVYRGSPVSGVLVAYNGHSLGQTDKNGEARVRLREKGFQALSAGLRRPLNSPEADEVVLKATLIFEVAP